MNKQKQVKSIIFTVLVINAFNLKSDNKYQSTTNLMMSPTLVCQWNPARAPNHSVISCRIVFNRSGSAAASSGKHNHHHHTTNMLQSEREREKGRERKRERERERERESAGEKTPVLTSRRQTQV